MTMFSTTATGSTIGSGYIINGQTVTYTQGIDIETHSGTEIRTTAQRVKDTYINPALFFRLTKSKLNKIEQDKLKNRLNTLYKQVRKLEDCGQQAAFETLAAHLSCIVRESEAVACGYSTWVSLDTINKFKKYQNLREIVHFKKLEDFPRVIPDDVIAKIKDIQDKKVFDSLHVLYLDYTKEELKTNKQKIKEKDPILFGKFAVNDERYYYIADWIDEKCDLTLKSFIKELEAIADASFDHPSDVKLPSEVEDIDLDYIYNLNKYVKEQSTRLAGTKASNYKEYMEQEDKDKENREVTEEDREKAIQTLKKYNEAKKSRADDFTIKEENTTDRNFTRDDGPTTLVKRPWWKSWWFW